MGGSEFFDFPFGHFHHVIFQFFLTRLEVIEITFMIFRKAMPTTEYISTSAFYSKQSNFFFTFITSIPVCLNGSLFFIIFFLFLFRTFLFFYDILPLFVFYLYLLVSFLLFTFTRLSNHLLEAL